VQKLFAANTVGETHMNTNNGHLINVMIVDDHQCMLLGLEKLIDGESCRMHVVGKACNRADAIALAHELNPDVILLDLDLNGECSLDFLPELRLNSNVHILVFTGTRNEVTREYAMLRGASGVVNKDQPGHVVVKAIECVHRGEIWLDRVTTAKVFNTFANKNRQNEDERKMSTLTPKEREIINVVVNERGAKSCAIADKLHMSDHTLKNHLTSIYAKLGVKNRIELVMQTIEKKRIPFATVTMS
jgi:two-component system nitrate/nitrite response regulator NarL